jgi:hypothetical protein
MGDFQPVFLILWASMEPLANPPSVQMPADGGVVGR